MSLTLQRRPDPREKTAQPADFVANPNVFYRLPPVYICRLKGHILLTHIFIVTPFLFTFICFLICFLFVELLNVSVVTTAEYNACMELQYSYFYKKFETLNSAFRHL